MKKIVRKSAKKSNSSKSVSHHSRAFLDRGQGQMKMMILVILILLVAGAVVFFTRTLTGGTAMTTGSRANEYGTYQQFPTESPTLTPTEYPGGPSNPPGEPYPTSGPIWKDLEPIDRTCVENIHAHYPQSQSRMQCSPGSYDYISFICNNRDKINLSKGPNCYMNGTSNQVTCRTDTNNPPRCMSESEVKSIAHRVCGCGNFNPRPSGIRIDDPTPVRE